MEHHLVQSSAHFMHSLLCFASRPALPLIAPPVGMVALLPWHTIIALRINLQFAMHRAEPLTVAAVSHSTGPRASQLRAAAADELQHTLDTLGEYITDSEDFINISMDAVRNRLIKWEIVIDTATFALAIYAVVAGVLGENLTIAPQAVTKTQGGYVLVNAGMVGFCALVFASIMLYARRRGLV